MGKAQPGNNWASKRNLQKSFAKVRCTNFEPVYVSKGMLTAVTRLLRELPERKMTEDMR